MFFFLNLLAVGALAGMCLALWHPEKMYPFKNPTWIKAVGLYFAAAVVFFILASSLSPDGQSGIDAPEAPAPSAEEAARPAPTGPLTWREVERENIPVPGNGRNWLAVTIVPDEDQARAGQKELLATATSVAVKMQKEDGVPVVIVNLICQEADNDLARRLLAQVVYIPDGKGFDGADADSGQWETLRAAKRGFTHNELAYLRAYGELYNDFHSATGLMARELDAAASARAAVPAGSMHPFDNKLEAAQE